MDKKRPRPKDGSDPFEGMVIASHEPLHAQKERSKCPECSASRKYFCYTCLRPMPELEGKLPVVQLPVKVDVIKHARELDGKSTAVHAAILAPADVTIYTYPCIPDYDDRTEKVVLVYPGKDAVSLDKLTQKKPSAQRLTNESSKASHQEGLSAHMECPFTKVVFIDCTWNQTNQIYKDERLRGLPCVILKDRTTCFWRNQKDKPDSYLATIEAIYHFIVDYHRAFLPSDGGGDSHLGCYDNLLYFYSFMYELVHQRSRSERRVEAGEESLENG